MDPLELKQILTALRKGFSLVSNEIEMIRKAYWYARTFYRRMEQGEGYRHHTIRLAHRLVTEFKIYLPDLLCGVFLHHLDTPSATISLNRHFPPPIGETAKLLSPLYADNFPAEEAYWSALRQAPLPLRITKVIDQVDHLEHIDGVQERNRLLRETVKWVQPMADITNAEIASLLREAANRANLRIHHQPDSPDSWPSLSEFLVEHPEYLKAYAFGGATILHYLAFYLTDRLVDFFMGRRRILIDEETETQWTLDKAKGREYKGRWEEACHIYQALLQKDPLNWEARIRLAELYKWHLKDIPKAQEEYERIMNSAPPESIWHRRAREALQVMQKDYE